MSDLLEKIRQLRPDVFAPDPALLARERDRLMARIAAEAAPVVPRRQVLSRRRRVSLMIALPLVALVGAAAGGWALSRDSATATEVACQFDERSMHQIDSSTGDPVADCGAEWRRLFDSSPPALVAFDNGLGGITVVRDGVDVPSSWRPLASDFRQDARLIELDATLSDHGRGLESACTTLAQARTLAEAELARLRLRTWIVSSERGSADGAATCTTHYLDRDNRRVVLFPLPSSGHPVDAPYRQLARRLSQLMTSGCLTVDAAVARARREAQDVGLDEAAGEVLFHTIDGAACARITVNVGGRVEVTIRGDRP